MTVVSALTAGLGAVVVSASMVLLNSVSQRYPPSTVDYLLGYEDLNDTLSAIYVAFIFSMLSLVLRSPGYAVAACCTVLALVSINALVTYLRRSSLLFHPVGMARRLVDDNLRRIDDVAKLPSGGPGESVLNHLQRQMQADLGRLEDLLTKLIEGRLFREAGETLWPIAYFLQQYLGKRRLIPAGSAWYPKRVVAAREEQVVPDIRHIHEQLALGPVTTEEPWTDWVEQRTVALLERVITTAQGLEEPAGNRVVRMGVELLEKLGLVAWAEQELKALQLVLAAFQSIGEATPGAEVGNTGIFILSKLTAIGDSAAREGFGLERLQGKEAVVVSQQKRKLFSLQLPTAIHQELLEYQEKLANEQMILGKLVTPIDWASEDMQTRLKKAEAEAVSSVALRVLTTQATLLKSAMDSNQGELSARLFVAGLQFCERLQVHRRQALASELLPQVVEPLLRVLATPGDGTVSMTVLKGLRIAALKAVSEKRPEESSIFASAIAQCVVPVHQRHQGAAVTSDRSGLPAEMETLLVLGGLAYLASEFTGDRRYIDQVTGSVSQAGISLAALASTVLPAMTHPSGWYLTFGSRLTLEYDRFFRPFFHAIGSLPEVQAPLRPGARGIVTQPDHPSRFVQRLGRRSHRSVNDCILGFLQSIAGTDARPEEEQGSQRC